MIDTAFSDIAEMIELSVAPVFLLVAIGSFLNVTTLRLGRVVDRARVLEDRIREDPDKATETVLREELIALDRRMFYANNAINLSAAAALLVAIDVALLFLSGLAKIDIAAIAAILFIFAMIGIICGLMMFLAEISVATRTVRVRADLLKEG